MHFEYCPKCGKKLIPRLIGDEGELPYCEGCGQPYWDTFLTSVICAVINEYNEIALLRQAYVSTVNYVCVAGIIKAGETGEETARREIKEEVGLDVLSLEFIKSYYFENKNMLMLGFLARVKKSAFTLSEEVDGARWFPLSQAQEKLRRGGIAWQLAGEAKERLKL